MSTANQNDQQEARIVGYTARMKEQKEVESWIPSTEAEVDAMPALQQRPPRGWKLTAEQQEHGRRRQPTAEKMPEAADVEERESPPQPEAQQSEPVKVEKPARPEWVEEGSLQAMVWERPGDAAKLVRTMIVEPQEGEGKQLGPHQYRATDQGEPQEEETELPALQQVAILCVGVGQEVAAEVMKHLSDYEIEEITQAIAALKNVSKDATARVMEDFRQHLQAGEWVSQGGLGFARGALERAVGPRKAQEILERVTTRVSSGFYMLKNVAPDQIAPFISHEHPQTIALILSQLEPAQAAGIVDQLPKRMQADVAYRMATMENITPAVIKQIEEMLESSLRDILGGNQNVGGPKVVADVLNLTGSSTEKNVLDQMDAQDPEVAESVRNLMFVFEDISKLTNPEIQILLRELDDKDLVIALKAASKEMTDRVLGNMSEEARKKITEEMEFLGPMRLSEVEEVQLRVVQQVRQLEEQGQITIVRGDAEDTFV